MSTHSVAGRSRLSVGVCVALFMKTELLNQSERSARPELAQQEGEHAMRCLFSRASLPDLNDGLHLYCHD